ncbi:lysophospholipid acyltransferase family protein [Flavobacterium taihuense]|uniref:Lysophospholipid acyltransferase family protein n=1 Tax=Flavobacterium taihuense TaxID=2857508 RepID=A0ABS6Y147_9FLAO|nr:lysophospholipid acyltransferase family protein [Flavobacterium taihuense]MBW4361818.1 lysophospholipid acyltransferase family protein [Flavobacterium taihuense]
MQYLIYLLVYPIIWVISILPFRLLYLFSDLVYFFVYRVIRYRKKTVRENLALTLPHLSDQERLIIEKKFYHHMCDMFLEMIKTMSISKDEICKRFIFKNIEVYKELEKQGKSIAVICSHYASYEWIISMNYYSDFIGYGIYKQLKNPYFDKLVHRIRSRFNAKLITTKQTIPTIIENNKNKVLSLYGFASDQSPRASSAFHWTKFMGIEVPVHTGAEMLSKRYDMNLVYLNTKKVKRGYYEATLELLSDHPKEVPNYDLTDQYLKLLEKQIYEAPEYYLWTHKRWKYKRDSI